MFLIRAYCYALGKGFFFEFDKRVYSLVQMKALRIINFSVWVVFTHSVAKFRGLPKSFEMTACVLRATSLTSSASIEERHAT